MRLRLARLGWLLLGLCSLGWSSPPPHQYGRVVLDSSSSRAGVPAVSFDHWRHRARFTCRLCHVDVGFAMTRGATGISASTNRSHFHCGACHDGKKEFEGKPIFASCSDSRTLDGSKDCRRCHAPQDSARQRREYEAFAARLPRASQGYVDWEKAEEQKLIRPLDFLAGVSIQRSALKMDKDIAIESKGAWMADVIFSHKKHAVCHTKPVR